jgi:hypothetical protein
MTTTLDPIVYALRHNDERRAVRRTRVVNDVTTNDVADLADLLVEAKKEHTAYEAGTGTLDEDWPRFYAEFMLGLR